MKVISVFFVDDGAVHYHRPYLSGLSTKRSNSEEHKKATTSYWGKALVADAFDCITNKIPISG